MQAMLERIRPWEVCLGSGPAVGKVDPEVGCGCVAVWGVVVGLSEAWREWRRESASREGVWYEVWFSTLGNCSKPFPRPGEASSARVIAAKSAG